MKKFTAIAAMVLILVVMTIFAISANAQTAQPDGAATMTAKIDIRARPKLTTTIPLNEPAQIDLGSLNVPGAAATLTEGVTVKAFTRYVEFEGRKIGQVVLVGVEKDGQQESLPTDAYTAQFDLSTPELDTAKDVVIKGDGAALIAALERLSQAAPPAQDVVAAKDKKNAPPQSGAPASKNAQAAAYKTPDPVKATPDAAESVRVTTAGCPIRIDTGQMRAVQQSKTETMKGGALVSESACTDSSEGFDLQKSYTVCSDQIDLPTRKATAQFVLFYVDAGGSRQEISECAPDTEKVFPIVEKASACTIFLDYTAMKAVPQSALIYQNDNNAEVQVRGCQASETKLAVAMTETTSGCTIRHDFTANKSFQQTTHTYLLDGIQYQAGGCTDNGTAYAHNKLYTDSAGGNVCPPVVDLIGGKVTLQSRIQITVNGVAQYINDCTPDTTGQLPLVATTNGCTNLSTWVHDLAAAQSYGEERYYYTSNGKQTYVTGCQKSQAVYAHQVETTGWQNHDDQLFAYPLDTVYIVTPTGRYDIQVSQVQSGATQMPYQMTGTATTPTGVNTYSGCDKYAETQQVEQWKRPDTTTYEKPIGPGAVVGPTNVCVDTVVASQSMATGSYYSGPGAACGRNQSGLTTATRHTLYNTVNKIERKNVDNGQVVSTTCAFANGTGFGGGYSSPSGSICTSWGNQLRNPVQTLFVGPQYTPACPF